MIRSSLMNKIAWMRLVLSRASHRLLLGPVSGNIPRSFVRSIEESSCETAVEKHLQSTHTILKAQVVDYNLPQEFPSWFRRQKSFDAKKIYMMKNVVLSPRSGLIWTDRGVLFGESIGDLFRLQGWGACLHEPLVPFENLPVTDPVVCCPNALYYHWLLEWLPNLLYALELFPDLKIIICKNSPSFASEALQLILGRQVYEEKVIVRPKTTPIYVSRAVLPALTACSGYVPPEDLACIRKAIAAELIQHAGPTKIYVSRAHASRRRLPDEKEIERLLRDEGFEIIRAEEMSFQRQIKAFTRAETIVAPHGAGLSNMIWRTGQCQIVELFSPDWINDCYARLSALLNFDYHYHMIPKTATASETVDRILAALRSD